MFSYGRVLELQRVEPWVKQDSCSCVHLWKRDFRHEEVYVRCTEQIREGVKLVEVTRRQLHQRPKKCHLSGSKSSRVVGEKALSAWHLVGLSQLNTICPLYVSTVTYQNDQKEKAPMHCWECRFTPMLRAGEDSSSTQLTLWDKGACDPKPGDSEASSHAVHSTGVSYY